MYITNLIIIVFLVLFSSLLWLNNRCRSKPACTHLWAWLSVTNWFPPSQTTDDWLVWFLRGHECGVSALHWTEVICVSLSRFRAEETLFGECTLYDDADDDPREQHIRHDISQPRCRRDTVCWDVWLAAANAASAQTHTHARILPPSPMVPTHHHY